MNALLAQAVQVLTSGAAGSPESRRGACWLARVALEDAVEDLLAAHHLEIGRASMHLRLMCLESLHPLGVPGSPTAAARHAWAGLSNAAHHHAYQLAPTVAEVEHLIALVAEVAAHPSVGAS